MFCSFIFSGSLDLKVELMITELNHLPNEMWEFGCFVDLRNKHPV